MINKDKQSVAMAMTRSWRTWHNPSGIKRKAASLNDINPVFQWERRSFYVFPLWLSKGYIVSGDIFGHTMVTSRQFWRIWEIVHRDSTTAHFSRRFCLVCHSSPEKKTVSVCFCVILAPSGTFILIKWLPLSWSSYAIHLKTGGTEQADVFRAIQFTLEILCHQ